MFDLKGYETSLLEGPDHPGGGARLPLLALVLSACWGPGQASPTSGRRGIAAAYTTVIRGIPDLVLMMLLFFGGQVLINGICTWVNEAYNNYLLESNPNQEGSRCCRITSTSARLRPGGHHQLHLRRLHDRDLPRCHPGGGQGELEAARAFGMRASQVFVRDPLPQMMRHAPPGFGNNWLVLLKTTALVSIIGLDDMVRKASLAAGSTQQPFTFYMAVALIFLIFTAVSTSALQGPSVTTRSRRGKPWISRSFSRSGPPTGRASPPSGWWRPPHAGAPAGGAHGHTAQQPQLADQGTDLGLYLLLPRHPLLVQLFIIYRRRRPVGVAEEQRGLVPLLRGLVLRPAGVHPQHRCLHRRDSAGRRDEHAQGQIEVASAFGMTRWQTLTRIIPPNSFRRALPAYSNEVIFMLQARRWRASSPSST